MARLAGVGKVVAVSLAIGAALAGMLYAIEHINLTGRAPIEVDIGSLSRDDLRKPLLASFPRQDFRCEPDQSHLGVRLCWAEIESFNGIGARYLGFFFDKDDRLTAFKLAAYSDQHARIVELFTSRFGPPRSDDAPFLAWPTGTGVLTTTRAPPEGAEATVLWVDEPAVVRDLTAPS